MPSAASPHTHMPRTDEPVIEIVGLRKTYAGTNAVNNVDLTVYRNEIFGILGPNGAGKTTLLEMVEGLRDPDAGSINVAGIDVTRNKTQVKRIIGVQLQTTALFDYLTSRELVKLFCQLYDGNRSDEWVDELIAYVDLEAKAGDKVNALSGGQKQRLSIALAMVNDPQIIFLDEPTTGLDPVARRNLWELVKELRAREKTVVLTTHYMEEAEYLCDRVAVMDSGNVIACDTPRALIASLGERATVFARLSGDISEAELDSLPNVESAEMTGTEVRMQTTDVAATVRALLLLAEQRGLRVDNLSTTGSSLEDVFIAYTGRSLQP